MKLLSHVHWYLHAHSNLVFFKQQGSREGLSDEDVQGGGIVGIKTNTIWLGLTTHQVPIAL